MNRIKNRLDARDDTGAVAIIVAICTVVFIGIAAFSIDMGIAYAVDREHSVTADAAALSGAQAAALEYKTQYPAAGPGCTTATASDVEDEATTAAQETYDDNDVTGADNPVVTDVTCEQGNFLVTVTTGSDVDAVFGPVLGVDTLHPGAQATAIVSGSPAFRDLRPYGVCSDDFDLSDPDLVTATHDTVFPQNWNTPVTCNGTSGQWGVIDFDGGSNPTGDIEDWTQYGYPGTITFPTPLLGDPGANLTPIVGEFQTLINDSGNPDYDVIIVLPVIDGWTGGGGGAEVHSPGVLTAKMCGVSVNMNQPPAKKDPSCWDQALYDAVDPQSKFYFQWQYVASSTSYTSIGSGTICDLSDATCVPGIRLWRNP